MRRLSSLSRLTIGGVELPIGSSRQSLIPSVPRKYEGLMEQQRALSHILFLARKYVLGQDALLMSQSPSGLYAKLIALRFLQMARIEAEFVTLVADVRESDLKQRREFRKSSAVWEDESAVRAALEGRVLVLDGLHRCDPNVLPILNSLLEQREMQLEDGRLIVSHTRFQSLLKTSSPEQLERRGLLSCHPRFRVLALALPVPPNPGLPLDPPLRSRLQCRYVEDPPLAEVASALASTDAAINPDAITKAVSVTSALLSARAEDATAPPDVPDVKNSVISFSFSLAKALSQSKSNINIPSLVRCYGGPGKDVERLFESTSPSSPSVVVDSIVRDLYLRRGVVLSGKRGSGRHYTAREVATRLKRPLEAVTLVPQMSERELFCHRGGSSEETFWSDSALTRAMKNGSIVVMEGLENAHEHMAAVVKNLLLLETVRLPDGSVLVSRERFDEMPQEERERGRVQAIHDDFKLIALFDEESRATKDWCQDPFSVHIIEPHTAQQVAAAVSSAVPSQHDLAIRLGRFVDLLAKTRSHHQDFGVHFGIRNCIMVAQVADHVDPIEHIRNAVLFRFLKVSSQDLVNSCLKESKLLEWKPPKVAVSNINRPPKNATGFEHLIPAVRFASNPMASSVLQKVDAFLDSGLPVLLVGVQGTGKNLLIDHLLQVRGSPRHYIQLHSDVSQGSVWSQRTIQAGAVVSQESPLLAAIRQGHVCVLDEIDKAPPGVVATVAGLLTGMFRMPDGRLVISSKLKHLSNDPSDIVVADGFQLILLANPGVFPFLGSNVLKSLGHEVNAIVVDPPDVKSMLSILESYNVNGGASKSLLQGLAQSFSDLFRLNIQGELSYAFGLREAISVVKDLQLQGATIESALSNVFDYEITPATRLTIVETLMKNGIQLKHDGQVFASGAGRIQPDARIEHSYWNERPSLQDPKHGRAPDGKQHVGGNTWAGGSGGNSTAGLGGRHGPYRLDAGFEIHQVADAEKVWTDPAAEARARALAKEALEKKLEEIRMGKVEYETYHKYLTSVKDDAEKIRFLAKNLTASTERKWLRNLTDGQLDERRLVEALSGDQRIFKKLGRSEKTPNNASGRQGKVYLRFLLDCSASMYRFNSRDFRLQRMIEATIMLLEGFSDVDAERLEIYLVGHSGEDKRIELLEDGKLPKTLKDRFAVLERIVAHSQMCWSGDETFAAVKVAIKEMEQKATENDESHVFVLSDANFSRYGMDPREFGRLMESSEKVDVTAIFIGSLGSEAMTLQSSLPHGKAFVCLRTADIPHVLATQLSEKIAKTHL